MYYFDVYTSEFAANIPRFSYFTYTLHLHL